MIKSQLREFISSNFLFSDNSHDFTDDTSLLDSAIVDSIGMMELVMFVEGHFKIHIPDHDLVPDNFDSVNKLSVYIYSRTG